jgi:hypothetical protein
MTSTVSGSSTNSKTTLYPEANTRASPSSSPGRTIDQDTSGATSSGTSMTIEARSAASAIDKTYIGMSRASSANPSSRLPTTTLSPESRRFSASARP